MKWFKGGRIGLQGPGEPAGKPDRSWRPPLDVELPCVARRGGFFPSSHLSFSFFLVVVVAPSLTPALTITPTDVRVCVAPPKRSCRSTSTTTTSKSKSTKDLVNETNEGRRVREMR